MDKATYKKLNKIIDIVGVVLIIALVLITFIGWINAPEIVPTHYNFNGEVDGYGSKNTMFILLPVVVIVYIGMAILSKYPEVYNYCVEINPINKEKQYLMASTFMKIINIEIASMFFYTQSKIVIGMNSEMKNLSSAFLPISLIVIFGTIAIYIRKSIKNK
ncbi:DUF1648 domain-containing protein [Clostridium chauvoei]|uniref:DUF1648 domain-containing protein n=4 Tax=Clostridium chauvoei TaxID=46867 RepID=S6FK17_9CLOT|nr:DUF1648 domain-containing protein [Clostridium chauvoei]ATD54358.1 hypothetical protein BTM20_03560 [Clostridium chauvoei]ATD57958.1 hypothetical protein BTM21_09500 [Clostridium chauvoei]MBX7279752.1 DUF1648 domain-containing protein [Clostridium chauvoei]MBX7282121.1 DUF1648 domain-containing protein [Clostridium chauvoei]MBX7284643.1 DUF1648 domain-containing protein [Clostridium chauvoei]